MYIYACELFFVKLPSHNCIFNKQMHMYLVNIE